MYAGAVCAPVHNLYLYFCHHPSRLLITQHGAFPVLAPVVHEYDLKGLFHVIT